MTASTITPSASNTITVSSISTSVSTVAAPAKPLAQLPSQAPQKAHNPLDPSRPPPSSSSSLPSRPQDLRSSGDNYNSSSSSSSTVGLGPTSVFLGTGMAAAASLTLSSANPVTTPSSLVGGVDNEARVETSAVGETQEPPGCLGAERAFY